MPDPSVLIVDDVRVIRLAVASALDPIPVLHAGDAAEALEQFFRGEPAVVLLDITLPEVDGLTILKIIRQHDRRRGRETPVVMVSGEGTADRVREAVALGIQGFLVKPLKPETLVAKVKEQLENAARP